MHVRHTCTNPNDPNTTATATSVISTSIVLYCHRLPLLVAILLPTTSTTPLSTSR